MAKKLKVCEFVQSNQIAAHDESMKFIYSLRRLTTDYVIEVEDLESEVSFSKFQSAN